jgi:spore germination protein PC
MQIPYYWNGALPPPEWSQLTMRIFQAEQKLQQLTESINRLQKQVDDLKSNTPLHVEYHFDQLKINRLEGTLHVGMSPQGIKGIESMETPDLAAWNITSESSDDAAGPIRSLQQEMSAYMDQHAASLLAAMEQKYGMKLEENHRKRLLGDVKNQLNGRIHYYGRVAPYPLDAPEVERQKWGESIKEKTLRDIRAAFSSYLDKLKQQSEKRSAEPE